MVFIPVFSSRNFGETTPLKNFLFCRNHSKAMDVFVVFVGGSRHSNAECLSIPPSPLARDGPRMLEISKKSLSDSDRPTVAGKTHPSTKARKNGRQGKELLTGRLSIHIFASVGPKTEPPTNKTSPMKPFGKIAQKEPFRHLVERRRGCWMRWVAVGCVVDPIEVDVSKSKVLRLRWSV